jgi:predicted GH43/DUF377 family glycosyl hydrolase
LSWTDNTVSETGFTIERCEGATCDFSTGVTTFTVGADVTTYSDTSACENTTYKYRVKAVKSLEWESDYSNEASATTDAKAAPTNLTATATSESQIDLTWTDNTEDETGFKIERCTGDGCSDFGLLAIVPETPDPVSYWKLDEGSGTTVSDMIGNNNGTINGATWSTGKYGNALSFDGVDDYVSIPESGIPSGASGEELTVEFWLNANDLSNTKGVIGIDNEWLISLENNGQIWIRTWGNNNGGTTSTISTGTWYHIAVIWIVGSEFKVYVNGELWTSNTTSTTDTSSDTGNSLMIGQILSGGSLWGNRFNGYLDEIVIYDRALSSSEILTHYQNGDPLLKIYSDTGLDPGTTYTYRVSAYKDATCGWETAFTNTASATTLLPPAPSDLTASVISTTQIDLSWTDNTDTETSFKIQRCTGIGCDFSIVDEFTVAANVTTYSDISVCENTTYRYRVRAEKSDGPVWQTEWSISTSDVTTPAVIAPGNLTATKIDESQIDLSWTDNTDDETGFKIERCVGTGCTDFVQIADVNEGSDTSLSLLLHMDETSWNGTSGEVIDSSSYGNHGTAYGGATTVTDGRFARAGSFDGTNDYISIPHSSSINPTNAITVELWAKSNTANWNSTGMLVSKRNAYIMYPIGNSKTIRFYIYSGGWRYTVYTPSIDITQWHHYVGTFDGSTIKLYIDGSLVASTSYSGSIKSDTGPLYIGRDDGYSRYFNGSIDEVAIYSRALSADEILEHYNNGIKATKYSDTGLIANETYRYRVYAYKDATCAWATDYSNEAEAITTPPPPTDLVATAVNTTQIDLSWTDNNATETGFKIERCQGTGCTNFIEIATVNADVTTYSDTTVCENTTYNYRVKAYKSGEWESGYSNESSTTTPAIAAPTGLIATRVSEVELSLSWTDNSIDETGFKIERCENTGLGCTNFVEIATVAADVNTYNDVGLSPEKTYTYRVRAYKIANCGWTTGYSNTDSATTSIVAPSNLTATAVNTTQIDLSWTDNSASETLLRIERCTGTGCADFVEIDTVEANTTTYSDTTVCNSTAYTYRIKAQKEGVLSNSGGGCWTRRVPLTITDFQSNYQTKIIIPYDADMQMDFDDIRFYDETAKAELPYWIESKTDGDSATVYFKTLGNNVYMYYGNSSATSSSDVTKTFGLYDPADTENSSDFTKSDSNPVLNLGAGGTWDDAHVYAPSVLKDNDGTYKMWYSGHDGSTLRIGYATSPDGITWTKYSGNPVLNIGGVGAWDDAHVAYPSVLKDSDGTYKMWYSGHDGASWRIGYATSTDGVNWTKYSSNPVLNLGASGTWDDAHVLTGKVIKENGVYKMWYAGHDGSRWRIGYATSTDGVNWTKYSSNPVLNLGAGGTWDDAHVYISMVMRDSDDIYKMWYTGHDGSNTRIGYATSSDGVSWSKYNGNPVLDLGAGGTWEDVHVYSPMIYKGDDGIYRLWYAGYDGSNWRIGYASVRPRKIATPEPTVSIGIEEQSMCYTFGAWETGYSNEASATTFTLSAPTNLVAVAVTDTDTELTWTDNSMDETGFKIERCAGEGCTDFIEVAVVGEGITSYMDTGLNPETTYCYRVRAYKDATCGWNTTYSNEACDITFSARPTNLVATAINSLMIRLDWIDNANDEDGYEVEVQIFNGKFVNIATLGPNVTTFTDTMGIEPEKEYRYRVRAFRGTDKTPYSNEATVTTPAWQEGDTTCP